MLSANKILLSSLFISYMALGSAYVYGQDSIIDKYKPKRPIAIGFQTGREQLFQSASLLHIKTGKAQCQVNNSLYVIKTLSKHIKLETGIKYSTLQSNTASIKGLDKKNTLVGKQKSLSTPFTLQYYFIPEHSRVYAYCGAGLQYNLLNRSNTSRFTSDINVDNRSAITGTKYLSVLITQGITFQINTKIQLSESFHFSAGDTAKTLGFDIGVGYIIR